MPSKHQVVIRLSGDLALRMRELCDREHRSPSRQVQHWLSQSIAEPPSTSIYMDAEPAARFEVEA
jgi:predicted transcriptional regulator